MTATGAVVAEPYNSAGIPGYPNINHIVGDAESDLTTGLIKAGYDLTPDVSFFAQVQDARIWGSEGSPAGTTNAASSSGIGAISSQNTNGTGVARAREGAWPKAHQRGHLCPRSPHRVATSYQRVPQSGRRTRSEQKRRIDSAR